MPAPDSPVILVARFLQASGFHRTLATFLEEAGLDESAIPHDDSSLTLEKVLEEKKLFDLSLAVDNVTLDEDAEETSWTLPYPSNPIELLDHTASNVLFLTVASLALQEGDPDTLSTCILATTADRSLHLYTLSQSPRPEFRLHSSWLSAFDSPILSVLVPHPRRLVVAGMSGRLQVIGVPGDKTTARRTFLRGRSAGPASGGPALQWDSLVPLLECRDHTKYIVKLAMLEIGCEGNDNVNNARSSAAGEAEEDSHPDGTYTNTKSSFYIASAGYDHTVQLYKLHFDDSSPSVRENNNDATPAATSPCCPISLLSTLSLQANPEEIVFYALPTPSSSSSHQNVLLLSRRDSPYIYVHALPSLAELYRISLNGGGDGVSSWLTFCAMTLAPSPTHASLYAAAVTTVPNGKLILVDVAASVDDYQREHEGRALAPGGQGVPGKLAVALFTDAPQSAYSTALAAWRPDGSGVWVNGDDGVIRGVGRREGKVVASLARGDEGGGHAGMVRAMWAGRIAGVGPGGEEQEVMLTGGFDKKLLLWMVEARG